MAQGRELERLFITLLADDSGLQRQLDAIVQKARNAAEEVSRAFEAGASKGFVDAGNKIEASAQRQKRAIDPVKEALERVKNETASLRNTVEAGSTSNEEAIRRFEELRAGALKAASGFERSSKEYRGYTQAAAMASRSIKTLSGEATKLGFSANNAIGVSTALRQNMQLLGPAGAAASRSLGLVGVALGGFARTGPGAIGALDGVMRGISRMTRMLPLLGALATGAAIAGLMRLGNAAAEVADKIDKGSQAAGLSAEAYQELRFAFDQSGVASEQFDRALQTLNRRIGQAAGGNDALQRSFSRLGVSIQDLATGAVRDTEAVFTDAINAISRLPSAAEQAAAASELFGDRIGGALLPALSQGVEGIEALREAARSAGLVLSGRAVMSLVQYKDALKTLQGQFETAKTEIVAGFIPVLTNFLIPLLQNTVVPWLQRGAEAVENFISAFKEQSAAGAAFRADIAANIVAVQAIAQSLISLGRISVGLVQVLTAPFAALGQVIGTLSVSLDDFLDVYRRALRGDFSGFLKSPAEVLFPRDAMARAVDAALQQARAGLDNLTDGGVGFFNAFDFDGNTRRLNEWLDGVVEDIERGATRFGAAGEEAGDAYASGVEDAARGVTIEPPPLGSLAAWRSVAAEARKEFELAITDEARRAAREREAIALAEVERITAIFATVDPLAPARAWTGRLAAELAQGVKNATEVFDLINPRLESLRVEARDALLEFGFDSTEYQTVVAKIELLESLLQRVEATARDIRIDPEQIAVDIATVNIPAPDVNVDVLTRPLAAVALRIAQIRAQTAEELELFRTDYSDWARDVAIANQAITSATNAPTEAFRIFTDTLLAMIRAGEDWVVIQEAIRNSPFADALTDFTLEVPEVPLLQRALAEQAAAYAAAQQAMTETALAEANRRLEIATEEVTRLRALGLAVPEVVTVDGGDISQTVADRLAAAAAAAEAFGTQSGLAAVQAGILADEINRTLADDPEADISALVASWRGYSDAAREAADATRDFDTAQATLDGVRDRIQVLSGTAQTEFDKFRDAVITAFDFGVINTDELDELLAVIEELPGVVARVSLEGVASQLERDFAVAEAAASAFGDETEAAAEKQALLAAAIRATLALDPSADISQWVSDWEAYRAAVEGAAEAERAQTARAAEIGQALEFARAQAQRSTQDWEALRGALREAAEEGRITDAQLQKLLATLKALEIASVIQITVDGLEGIAQALEGLRDGDLDGVLSGLTAIGTAVGFAIGGPAGAAIAQAIGQALQTIVRLGRVLSDLFTGDSPARRELAKNLAGAVSAGFRQGILDGLKGAEDWQARLRENVQDAVIGALIDAFIQAAIIESIFGPFIDQFTRLLNRSGEDAAWDFFDREFPRVMDSALDAAESFVRRGQRFFNQAERIADVDTGTGNIELPTATVTVLAAPQWALELNTAAQHMSDAGIAMTDAALLMQATFREGITVNSSGSRGIDAMRAA